MCSIAVVFKNNKLWYKTNTELSLVPFPDLSYKNLLNYATLSAELIKILDALVKRPIYE